MGFYEPDVNPGTQSIMSKHCRKTQWFGRLVLQAWYQHHMSNQQYQSTEGSCITTKKHKRTTLYVLGEQMN